MNNIAETLIEEYQTSQSDRSSYNNVYQLITDYITPFRGDFTSMSIPHSVVGRAEANNPDIRRQFTSEASSALNQLVSIITNRLTDPTSKWYKLSMRDIKNKSGEDYKRFLEEVEDALFFVFSGSESGFLEANYEAIADCVAYGTGAISILKEDKKIVYSSIPLSNIFIAEDHKGMVDTVFVRSYLTARQAEQRFGEESLGDNLRKALTSNSKQMFEFVQILLPKKDFERMGGRLKSKTFNYASLHIAVADRVVVREEGFRSIPIIVFRFDKVSGEVYGISPSFKCLTDIRLLNQTVEEFFKAAARLGSPVTLMSEEISMNQLDLGPDGIIIGAMTEDGKRLIDTLPIHPDLQSLLVMIERLEDKIAKAFSIEQFQPKRGVQPMTATETNTIEQNKLVLLSPQIKRIETEYLTKVIHRTLELMEDLEMLPEGPDEAGDIELKVDYISPLAFTMKSNQLLSYNRFISNAATLLQVDPTSILNIDIDASIRDMAEKSGMPLSSIRSKENVDAQKAEIQKQQQQKAQLENLQLGADATQKLAASGVNPLPQ